MTFGSEFADFLKSHISKIASGDDLKECVFNENSYVYGQVSAGGGKNFVEMSKSIAEYLFTIMNQNIAIPQADLIVCRYMIHEVSYLAFLKMNYKASYIHHTDTADTKNTNDIVQCKAVIPMKGQKITEAAIICMNDYQVQVLEKKYEVNGVKTNYFSSMFLECHGSLSANARLSIVTKAINNVQKKYCDENEQYEAQMDTKSIIHTELEEEGSISVSNVLEKVFHSEPEKRVEVEEKLEKYDILEDEIVPQNENTFKKYEKQCLSTDTGIELKIPMSQYQDNQKVEFITNNDGSISILLKNIGYIMAKI